MAVSPPATIARPAKRPAKARVLATYVSTQLDAAECRRLADIAGGIVLPGKTGASLAVQMRKHGYHGWLVLDPAVGKGAKPAVTADSLFGADEWLEREQTAKADELLSPGEFIPVGEADTLKRVIAEQVVWTATSGGGRAVLYLDGRWLQNGAIQQVLDVLAVEANAGTSIAVAFGDTSDPLKLSGAVAGYVRLLTEAKDVAVLRCDLGAVGGLANGAAWSSVGTGTSNRHFQPPNKKTSSGAPGSCPSALVRDLLTFKMGTSLAALPDKLIPVCHLPCCDGQKVSRFNDKAWAPQVRAHNVQTMAAIAADLVAVSADRQAKEWKQVCAAAVDLRRRLAVDTHDPGWDVVDQVTQWSVL